MATTQKESDRHSNTGVGYGVRHTISGRWYMGTGRFSNHAWPVFDGMSEARRSARRHLRETEIAFLELVPLRSCQPQSGFETEAARLLKGEPQPLISPVFRRQMEKKKL